LSTFGDAISCSTIQRRRRLSGHGHQLDHGHAAGRARQLAGGEGLSDRLRTRPAIARAVDEEFELYKAKLARHKAAA
jgi:hypothetical protein